MTVPKSAKYLLDRIGDTEAPQGYGTVYGDKQSRLHKPLTQWTVDEIIGAAPSFTSLFGSSACGRYQFMRATLVELKSKVPGLGSAVFSPEVQDELGYILLQRRGFANFLSGRLSVVAFGRALAQEWASFPVLATTAGAHRTVARGQSYYAGDGMNKALVAPETVEAWLSAVEQIEDNPGVSWASTTPNAVADFGGLLAGSAPEAPQPPAPSFIPPASASGTPKGIASSLWALVRGRPPVPKGDRPAVVQETAAELPHIAANLGGLRLAGLGGLFASLAGGASDTGLLDTVKGTADQATATFQSVQALVNILLNAVRWGVLHWWVFGIAVSLYVLAKVGWAVYGIWMQIQQWRVQNATLAALKAKTVGATT